MLRETAAPHDAHLRVPTPKIKSRNITSSSEGRKPVICTTGILLDVLTKVSVKTPCGSLASEHGYSLHMLEDQKRRMLQQVIA
jgi:hypothetical protein